MQGVSGTSKTGRTYYYYYCYCVVIARKRLINKLIRDIITDM